MGSSSTSSSSESGSSTSSLSGSSSSSSSSSVSSSVSSSSSSSSSSLTEEEQYSLLNSMFIETGGSSWGDSTNWGDESISFCDWHGIDCDESKNVNIVFLSGNGLTGTFPTTLGLFSSTLQILVLDDNSLTGTLPTELGLLKNLEYFSITGNELTGNVPNEICDITESQGGGFLQTLDVDCESVDC